MRVIFKTKKSRLIAILALIGAAAAIWIITLLFATMNKGELISVKSDDELLAIYNRNSKTSNNFIRKILGLPFSAFSDDYYYDYEYRQPIFDDITNTVGPTSAIDTATGAAESSKPSAPTKEYSTTNIQVENVDEADIVKTDGDYIYSISGADIVITNVQNSTSPEISARISTNGYVQDLILSGDKLVAISVPGISTQFSRYGSGNTDTAVQIYNISDRENPKLAKTFQFYSPYYTSRTINNQLYIISSGRLRQKGNKVERAYLEDLTAKEIPLSDIKYLEEVTTDTQTIISSIDLANPDLVPSVKSYLFDASNAYVSENSIYLLDEHYKDSSDICIDDYAVWSIFGIKGLYGLNDASGRDCYISGNLKETKIIKFKIEKTGEVSYAAKTNIDGTTINQFSIDEYDDHLRIALQDSEGSFIAVFDKNLEQTGETSHLAKDENMYSSRFVGDKAYFVTYRTVDPLYTFDLSDPANPKALGELKIPGYSTYLHPYDENHLIGIGMDTEERTHRDNFGRIISTSAVLTGMKMALFDISDLRNPKEISSIHIGDSRTTSAILTNHKALLFAKEKNLIAIPVNNYQEDFIAEAPGDNIEDLIRMYNGYFQPYISEGYLVYDISLEKGFTLKGTVTHDKITADYGYYYGSKMLRGLYIEDNLFTVSENSLKVNALSDLKEITELKLIKEKN